MPLEETIEGLCACKQFSTASQMFPSCNCAVLVGMKWRRQVSSRCEASLRGAVLSIV